MQLIHFKDIIKWSKFWKQIARNNLQTFRNFALPF